MIDRKSSGATLPAMSSLGIPHLIESRDEDDEFSDDGEEVIVFEHDETPRASCWEYWGEKLSPFTDGDCRSNGPFSSYTRRELTQKVTVVQSNRDPVTGNFVRVQQTLQWCLEQGCEEVKPKVWAKSWYFHYLYGEADGTRTWVDTQNRRLVMERKGKALEIEINTFDQMISMKEKANRDFGRGMFNSALEKYLKAEEICGGEVMGIYLVPEQRKELVNVLSNQAECYLRLAKYQTALAKATSVLQMDRSHVKSILRQGRAILYATEDSTCADSLSEGFLDGGLEGLRGVAQGNRDGSKEAADLLHQLGAKKLAGNRKG